MYGEIGGSPIEEYYSITDSIEADDRVEDCFLLVADTEIK